MKTKTAGSAVLAVALTATMCWPVGLAVACEVSSDASETPALVVLSADDQANDEGLASASAMSSGTLNLGRFRDFVTWTSTHYNAWSINIVDTGAPAGAETVDLSTEQDGSILGWKVERTDETITSYPAYDYYVSSTAPGVKVKAPVACSSIFASSGYSSSLSMDLTGLDVSGVTTMSSMFSNLSALKSLDITGWDTSHVTSMASMFYYCSGLSEIKGIGSLDVSSVASFNGMFHYCSGLTALDLSDWRTSSATNLDSMFSSCKNLTEVDLGNFAVTNVTSASGMFSSCSSLTNIDLSSWDTSKLTNASSMFSSCAALYEIDLSSWNTSALKDAHWMFYGCSSLAHIYVGDAWTVENVTNSYSMFYSCWTLPNYDNSCIDKTRAYAGGDGLGYLAYKSAPAAELSAVASTKAVACGREATFACTAQGNGESSLSYQWQYRTSSKGSWKNCSAEGCKTSSYYAVATSARAKYQYRCVVTASDGRTAASDPVGFDIALVAQAGTSAVTIGSTSSFKCTVTGYGTYARSYQWQYSTDGGATWKKSTLSTAKKSTLKVKATSARVSAGQLYRCVVTCGAWKAYTDPIGFSIK